MIIPDTPRLAVSPMPGIRPMIVSRPIGIGTRGKWNRASINLAKPSSRRSCASSFSCLAFHSIRRSCAKKIWVARPRFSIAHPRFSIGYRGDKVSGVISLRFETCRNFRSSQPMTGLERPPPLRHSPYWRLYAS